MSDEGKTIQPEHLFKKLIWRSTLDGGANLEKFTTWTITGIAAVVGLIISNLDSVAKIVPLGGIKLAIIFFALALLAGIISKQIGMAVASGLNTLRETENLLNSEPGQALMSEMTIAPRELVKQLAEPFLWPLSRYVRKGGERGLIDYVAADKKLIRLFCFQLLFNFVQGVLALAALVIIALSI